MEARLNLRLAFMAILALFASMSPAIVAFTTFGPADSYMAYGAYPIYGPDGAHDPQRVAPQFMSGATGTLGTLRVAVNFEHELTNDPPLMVSLRNDNQGRLGGVIGTWQVTLALEYAHWPQIVTVHNSDDSILLLEGVRYWVELWTTNAGTYAWHHNDQSIRGRLAVRTHAAGYEYFTTNLPAFEVTVAPVPEPASLLLLAFGVASLTWRRRRV